jgi:putative transposase
MLDISTPGRGGPDARFSGASGWWRWTGDHLKAAARYVALDPLRARRVARAQDWPHSSPRAHIAGVDDGLVSVQPLRDRLGDFAALLETEPNGPAFDALRRNAPIGRPLGSPAFLDAVSRRLGRPVTPAKRGRKPKAAGL